MKKNPELRKLHFHFFMHQNCSLEALEDCLRDLSLLGRLEIGLDLSLFDKKVDKPIELQNQEKIAKAF